jgi:hypothetical protein
MFSSENSICEWMPEEAKHNFGDYLMQLIGERVYKSEEWKKIQENKKYRFVLLGSFICNHTINQIIESGKVPVLVGCGYRGELLSARNIGRTIFLGCRGKDTKQALHSQGVEVEDIGDPAVILPALFPYRGPPSRDRIFMPHINDPDRYLVSASEVGCNRVIQPEIIDKRDLIRVVNRISRSRFVFAGAMHAAVVAHAYGVPFAFYAAKGGYIDCPPKWNDWLSSISSRKIEAKFFSSASEGVLWYEQNRKYMLRPRCFPILRQYQNLGALRRTVVFRSIFRDAIISFKELSAKYSVTDKFSRGHPESSCTNLTVTERQHARL